MTTYISKEVAAGLAEARKAARQKPKRLRVETGAGIVPILQMSDTGFSVAADSAPKLRGLVDIYDGTHHLSRALIIAATEEGEVITYDYKRMTENASGPALDFVRPTHAPVALIEHAPGGASSVPVP